jgi:transglutaminase-like putative cysteine protease
MSQRHPLALVAGGATLLSAMPLTTVFATFTWLFYTAIAIAAVVGTAMGVRALRGPVWAQVLAMVTTLTLYLTWSFPSGQEFAGAIPTLSTFQHFGQLLTDSSAQIRDEAAPVPDFDGLLLLTIAGVGFVAIMVDLLAVGLRRPALAGLPMLAIYSVPVAVMPDGLSFLPFGFAAAGYLWLLVTDSVDRVRRFGRRFTGEGRDVDVWEPSPLASAGRRLGVVGVVIAILLPLAIPGMTSGLLDRFGPGFGAGIGEGNFNANPGPTVDMFALLTGSLNRESAFTMVRLTTNDPQPYYLRFGVADQIVKNGFVSRAPASGQRLSTGLLDVNPPDRPGIVAQRFRAQIEVIDLNMQLAPVYQQLVGTEGFDTSWFFDQSTNQVFSRRSNVTGKSYGIEFVRLVYTPGALRTAGPIPGTDVGLRQLSSVPQIQQVTELVTSLIGDRDTQYDRVRAIHDFFSPVNGFSYTLRTEPAKSATPVVDFLANRKGFCVQYAAAMTWLVRAAGYPARVAFGFTRGSNPQNGVQSLTNFNLHAWTEVYFPDFGWVPFDPTPSGSVIGSVPTGWAPDPSDPGPEPTGPTGPGDPTPGPPVTAPPGDPTGGGSDDGGGAGFSASDGWFLLGGVGVIAILFMLFAPALRRRSLRRARMSGGGVIVLDSSGRPTAGTLPNDLVLEGTAVEGARRDAHAAWAELLDTMIDFDVPVDEAETPRATGDRVGGLPGLVGVRDHTSLLARAEERARYALSPLRPDGLGQALRVTRQAMTERATFRQRLSATLLPRSVLLRWRWAWVTWMNRMIGVAGRTREVVGRASPRRLLAVRGTR